MFNFFHKVFSSILTKPSVHYFKPKAINLFFKNSKNPQYHLLNLEKYSYVGIEATKEKQDEDNEYVLKLNLHNGVEQENLVVARFDNRQDLEKAMLVLKNKFYAPEKVVLKGLLIVVITFVVLLFLLNLVKQFTGAGQTDVVASNAQIMQQLQQMHQAGQIPQYQLPPAVANNPTAAYEALQQAKAQADQIVAAGAQKDSDKVKQAISGTQPTQPSQSPTAPTEVQQKDPAMQNFLNGLSK